MLLFRCIESSYNATVFVNFSDVFCKNILHGFFEGLCLVVYDGYIFLVGDDLNVVYQQRSGVVFVQFDSTL